MMMQKVGPVPMALIVLLALLVIADACSGVPARDCGSGRSA